jgi:hypothetical protein
MSLISCQVLILNAHIFYCNILLIKACVLFNHLIYKRLCYLCRLVYDDINIFTIE